MGGQDFGDPDKGGIMDAYDRAFTEESLSDDNLEPEQEEEVSTTPAEPDKPLEPEPPVIDEDFFSEPDTDAEADGEPQAEASDEAAFEKETEELTKGMEQKAGEKFKALRSELKAARQQTVTPEVQAKLAQLETKVQESEGLRARLDELSNQSAKLKVENSDEYTREVARPAANIFKKADELAALYEGTDPAVLKSIIQQRDRKTQNELIAEHLGDFSDFDRTEIYRMTQDFNVLLGKRGEMLEQAESKVAEFEATRIRSEEKALADQRAAVQTIQKDIWGKYKDKIPGFTDESGNETPEYKALLARSLAIDFGKARGKDQAYAAFAGTALPFVARQLAEARAELAARDKADGRAIKGRPAVGESIASSAVRTPEKKDEGIMALLANTKFD